MSYLDGSSLLLTPAQLATVGRQVGFSGDDLVMFVAVCLAESSGEAHIVHPNPDNTLDLGIAQINTSHAHEADILLAAGPGFFTLKGWKDPIANGRAARQLRLRKGNWTDWVTFNAGATNDHLTAARAAVQGTNPGDAYTGGAGAGPGGAVVPKNPAYTPYTQHLNINGKEGNVDVEDGVWQQFFDGNGKLQNIGSTRDNGYGKKQVVPIQLKLPDGTMIVDTQYDDASQYASLAHIKPDGKKALPISQVTLKDGYFAGYVTKDGDLLGSIGGGAGAYSDPLLGIPDAVGGVLDGEFLADAIRDTLGAIKPYLWIAGGVIAVALVVVITLKNSSAGKAAVGMIGKVPIPL